MDGRSVDGSSIESDRSRFFPDQASGEFREHEPQKEPKAGFPTCSRWKSNSGLVTRGRVCVAILSYHSEGMRRGMLRLYNKWEKFNITVIYKWNRSKGVRCRPKRHRAPSLVQRGYIFYLWRSRRYVDYHRPSDRTLVLLDTPMPYGIFLSRNLDFVTFLISSWILSRYPFSER